MLERANDTFCNAKFSVDIILSAMLVQDWYGHVRTHTSMSKSSARNSVRQETCTEPKVTRWS